jgi:DNA-binding response OmpR family regulator
MTQRPGCSVLVVEDEPLLAMDVERLLAEVGFRVMGPATSVARAVHFLEAEKPDLAVIDLNLAGEMVFPLLDILAERAIPFVVVSGHSLEMVPPLHQHRPFLQKPYEPAELLKQIHEILAGNGDRVFKRA